MRIDWDYPWMWGIQTKYKGKPVTIASVWLGWWLVTWWTDPADCKWWQTIEISFQPGL